MDRHEIGKPERRRPIHRWALLAVVIAGGCRTGPRSFQDLSDPSAFKRARAVGLGENVPESVAVPALIDRLGDPDAVVRLSAHEALKKRTGQDFGFVPYRDPGEQAEALQGWQTWWSTRQSQLVAADSSTGGAARTARRTRRFAAATP